MRSDASTVDEYLAALPENRRRDLEAVRAVILDHLPEGYEEAVNFGMITYQVPLDTYPDTYNRQPLMYAALAAQKRYSSLYLTSIYLSDESAKAFERDYRATGKRYDVGKSCVRFRTLDDLPLDLIARAVESTPIGEFIEGVEAARARR
jgi:uncharacterized protein YdhG (YjbR/CyaY superfamily)